ncbi:hypothetical protein [Sphaerisporangium aureirubrum]|uniref:Uncharacterized protein n=1 Tax=Sphaerisporangium aureirubrum TaxID=1544736 RepID=A0ABW1NXG4_9ACTN
MRERRAGRRPGDARSGPGRVREAVRLARRTLGDPGARSAILRALRRLPYGLWGRRVLRGAVEKDARRPEAGVRRGGDERT